MAGFECCRHCVAPKRHPGCHSTCPDYPIAKEDHNNRMKYLNPTDADKILIENGSVATDKLRKDQKKWRQGLKKRI